jgi:heme-degrading monooxygenase HmoA
MPDLALSLKPPYYAVIFSSVRTPDDSEGYEAAAERMFELGSSQPGFLGIESVRGADGLGVTISYWSSLAAIDSWREQAEHRLAQSMGREKWYERFVTRICRVERAYEFFRPAQSERA